MKRIKYEQNNDFYANYNIEKYRRKLTPEREMQLYKEIKENSIWQRHCPKQSDIEEYYANAAEAVKELVLANMPLAMAACKSVALQFENIDVDDLFAEACKLMYLYTPRYDYENAANAKYSTYIFKSTYLGLLSYSRVVAGLDKSTWAMQGKILKAEKYLYGNGVEDFDNNGLAEAINHLYSSKKDFKPVAADDVKKHRKLMFSAKYTSLQDPVNKDDEDDERMVIDTIESSINIEESLIREADRGLIAELLSCLTEKQKLVFVLRHVNGIPNKKIACMLTSSEANITQTLHRAEEKMRRYYLKNFERLSETYLPSNYDQLKTMSKSA